MSRKRSGIVKLETTSVPFLSVLVSMHVKIRPKKAEVGKKHFNGREASPLYFLPPQIPKSDPEVWVFHFCF